MLIVFHCTRVKNPDKDYQKKLDQIIRYLDNTRHLSLILIALNNIAEWWVDASFAIHEDMTN